MSLKRAVLAGLLWLAAGSPLGAQAIRGRVVDAAGEGVPEAMVAAGEGRQEVRVRTGADGAFALPLRGPGAFRLRVTRTGYAPGTSGVVNVALGETVEVEMRVAAQPLGLEPLTVKGRQGPRRIPALEASGYYTRQASGLGRFLGRDVMERRRGARLAQVLDDVPGVRLYRDRRGNEFVTFDAAQSNGAIRRAQAGEPNLCQPLFYLDGTMVASGTANGPVGTLINDLIQPEDIEAIEVYSNVSRIPPQYNGSSSACGVVLIWTRKSS